MSAILHAVKHAPVDFDRTGDASEEADHCSDEQVKEVHERFLNDRQRAAIAEAAVMVARVISDDGGETRAAKRLGRKVSFVAARVSGRNPWRLGDVLVALSPSGLDDLGKAIRTRADTLRGATAVAMPLVARMRRVHQETSEATAALMALVAADAPEPRALTAVARELRESIREQEAALADVEARLAAMGSTR